MFQSFDGKKMHDSDVHHIKEKLDQIIRILKGRSDTEAIQQIHALTQKIIDETNKINTALNAQKGQ